MSLDGMAMRALADDLQRTLGGGRIDKISQPNTTSMTMMVRAGGKNHRLYATISPQCARVSLTDQHFENPLKISQFCTVLRKHIQGAVIEDIHQIDWERMIAFELKGRNEIGEQTQFTLLFELMGKNSNIMLLDTQNTILDAIKRVGANTNTYRQFQPGIAYVAPPAQNKTPLEDLNEAVLAEKFLDAGLQKTASKALLQTVAGLGPQTVTELLVRANISPDTRVEYLGDIDYSRLYQQCQWLLAMVAEQSWQPTLVFQEREIFAFAPFPLKQYESFRQEARGDMMTLLEDFYATKERQEIFQQKCTSLERIVRRERERCEKKLQLQLEKIDELEFADEWRIKGELLTANLYRIKQGATAEVENFYKDGAPTETIEMNPSKTPNENAQAFFKKYNKAKVSADKAAAQAEKTTEELNYLRTIEDSIEQAQTEDDLIDIRLELEENDYVKRRASAGRKKTVHAPKPTHLYIDGYELYIGKNNHQNDYVTTKLGRNADLWLHTKDIHGAHVIIKNAGRYDGFSPEIIEKAAMLAAWFSKARYSSKVPVDYTLRKNVHKPSGAKPGMVIYTDQQTYFSTPDEATVEALLRHTEEARD
ncbi:MAG: NFACT RNA binding domain-containing protein [Peptococcaceae bacterium]|nr:NFACT RNA binding domain-containing protein [Peptococcaceae bacterium]